jgi:hypothetical protein
VKSDKPKIEKAKPLEAKGSDKHDRKSTAADNQPKFVDRQLQKAVEHLTSELARAP